MDISDILDDQNPWWRNALHNVRPPPYRRAAERAILARLAPSADRRAHVIVGPRQVGKTVILRQLVEDLLGQGRPAAQLAYCDFSDDRLTTPASPRGVVDLVERNTGGAPCVILLDEIAASDRWASWLKQAVDLTPHRYVLTDSASSILRGGGRESGLGRWDEWHLEPLTFCEFMEVGGRTVTGLPDPLEEYLALGGFPEYADPARASAREPRLARDRLRRDIVERAILRDLSRTGIDIHQVRRLFSYLAQEPGAEFVVARRADDLDAKRETVVGWLHNLEDASLVRRLPNLVLSSARRARAAPKIYPVDHGLVQAFAPSAATPYAHRVRAGVFETVVFRHLREVAQDRHEGLGFFRDRATRREIDFIVDHDGVRCGVEVTTSRRVDDDKRAALRAAAAAAHAERLIVVHGGSEDREHDHIREVPLRTFLLDAAHVLAGRLT